MAATSSLLLCVLCALCVSFPISKNLRGTRRYGTLVPSVAVFSCPSWLPILVATEAAVGGPRLAVRVLSANSLQIADVRQRSIFRFGKESLGRSVEKVQFVLEARGTLSGEALDQVFEHGAQAPRDLNTLAAEVADFGHGQMHEILPVGGSIDEP